MQQSREWYVRAQKVLPAGVNSPVRAFRSVGGDPIFMQSGKGAHMTDVDGKAYLDFCGSWGPLILGHANEEVHAAITAAIDKGWTFGTPCPEEVAIAELLTEKLPGLDMLRFVNSGTEAVMSAIRLARGFTGRDHILKFRGCYHGHVDYLLVDAGSGLATFGTASSKGVPSEFAALTATMDLDDPQTLSQFFDEKGDGLACVVIEGVPANNGLLIQRPEYVRRLRELCSAHGALLIFDEVLSGFRMPEGMAYQHYDVQPDLLTMGKVIGGGMPVGAYGGRKEIMEHISPLGSVYQAGTLSGNPVAMAAGYSTLNIYFRDQIAHHCDQLGQHLDKLLEEVITPLEHVGYIRIGSLFWFYFNRPDAPRRADLIHPDGAQVYAKLHAHLLEHHIYTAPSSYEVGFLNAAMTTQHLDQFGEALKGAVQKGILQ